MLAAASQRFDHLRPHGAVQQLEHIFPAHGMAQSRSDSASNASPNAVSDSSPRSRHAHALRVGVATVYAPKKALRQPAFALEIGESLERTFSEDAAKIPQYRFDCGDWAVPLRSLLAFFL